MARALFALLLSLTLCACNDSSLIGGPGEEPTPSPSPPPTIRPETCQFYSLDSDGTLWLLNPEDVTATSIGSTGVSVNFTDVTITPDEEILAITRFDVYEIAPTDATAHIVADELFAGQPVAADTLPDGRLLVGGAGELAVVDTGTGDYDVIGSLPNGWDLSGDIAVRNATTAYASVFEQNANGNDHLFRIDLITGATTDVGVFATDKMYGLDYGCDGRLYGVVAEVPPRFVHIDESTGQMVQLGTPAGPATLWGAAGPADVF